MVENGWEFKIGDGATGDHLFGAATLWQIYVKANPHYSGRATVPVLWDKKTGTIVNNESAEIIRMFNNAFNGLTGSEADFYPEDLRADIDAMNAMIYDTVNNGVYKAGFATAQEAYAENVGQLFETLDSLDERLGRAATSSATGRPKRTGVCSRRWCVSTQSMSAISSAISVGSPTTGTCQAT